MNQKCHEQNQLLKIGLLAPLSGEYRGLGNSLLYSLQMALEEIDDDNVIIIPRDSGLNNKEKLNAAIKDIRSQGARIIIGPINNIQANNLVSSYIMKGYKKTKFILE